MPSAHTSSMKMLDYSKNKFMKNFPISLQSESVFSHIINCMINEFQELMASNSLVFVNSEPLVDFPRPSSARIIDIGGIVVSSKHEPLNKVSQFRVIILIYFFRLGQIFWTFVPRLFSFLSGRLQRPILCLNNIRKRLFK